MKEAILYVHTKPIIDYRVECPFHGEYHFYIRDLTDAKFRTAGLTYSEVVFIPDARHFSGDVVEYLLSRRRRGAHYKPRDTQQEGVKAETVEYTYNKVAKQVCEDVDWQTLVDFPDFCTGKTMAHCMELIAKALKNPCTLVDIVPEYPHQKDTMYMRGGFIDELERYISEFGIKYMLINRAKGHIYYNPYGRVGKHVGFNGTVVWVDKG